MSDAYSVRSLSGINMRRWLRARSVTIGKHHTDATGTLTLALWHAYFFPVYIGDAYAQRGTRTSACVLLVLTVFYSSRKIALVRSAHKCLSVHNINRERIHDNDVRKL